MSAPAVIPEGTREEEEARIVATWLNRLNTCVSMEQRDLFARALADAKLGADDLEGAPHLRQHHLDSVVRQVRREIPDITLRLFARAEVLDLGLIGYAAVNCGTLGKALDVLYEYHSLASDRYVDRLSVDGNQAVVSPTPLPGYLDEYRNILEDSMSGNWRSLQVLLGPAADPGKIRVMFDYPPPDYVATYHEVFGPNCLFDQEEAGLRFPKGWLDIPINRSGGSLSQVFTAMCERILGPGTNQADTPEMVQRLLLSRSGRNMLRLEEAAEQLLLSPNQLRKRLYRAGTSYKKLVLKTRMDLARHYLMDTHLSVQEIAYLLDYATPAPFSRAFKDYYGLAPEHYRQAEKASPSA